VSISSEGRVHGRKRGLEIMHENEGGERRDEMRGGEVEEEKTSLVPVHE
jgi:hypothetical protein